MTTITRIIPNHDQPSPARLAASGPLPAPAPVDTTSTTRRSRLAPDGSVPPMVRSVWADLTPRQRDNVIKFIRVMESWDDLRPERRDELLQQKIEKYTAANAGRIEEIRRQNTASDPEEPPTPAASGLETRAAVARLDRSGYVVQCRECGRERPAKAPTSGRLPSGLCDPCLSRRETSRQRARARRLAEAKA